MKTVSIRHDLEMTKFPNNKNTPKFPANVIQKLKENLNGQQYSPNDSLQVMKQGSHRYKLYTTPP